MTRLTSCIAAGLIPPSEQSAEHCAKTSVQAPQRCDTDAKCQLKRIDKRLDMDKITVAPHRQTSTSKRALVLAYRVTPELFKLHGHRHVQLSWWKQCEGSCAETSADILLM